MNTEFPELKKVHKRVKQSLSSLINECLSPDIEHRRSTLSSHPLATVLADAVLEPSAEKTKKWIELHAQGINITGIPTPFSQGSPFMFACYTILEKMCGFSLPLSLRERMQSPDDLAEQLDYPLSLDSSYNFPLHLACVALFSIIGEIEMPHIFDMLYNLQQEDGSWADDVINTALSALALKKKGIEPKYDVQSWLTREQLPDGSWPVANGEVWEASYAVGTGEIADEARLISLLKRCRHPNGWWGFSRYSVPDTDDTAVACYALTPHEPDRAASVCENIVKVQHDAGCWGAFPKITGVVPHESVVGPPITRSNDITCHVLELLELNNRRESAFKKGISYLLEVQEHDGRWITSWWKSDIFGTTEAALLLYRNGYTEPALHAVDWLETQLDHSLNSVECALLMKAFALIPGHDDLLTQAVTSFVEEYSLHSQDPTYDSVYSAGLIDCAVYRLSIIVSALRTVLVRD